MYIVCRITNGIKGYLHSDKVYYSAFFMTDNCVIKVYKHKRYAEKVAKKYGGFIEKYA
jgi:hypothetical protein